MIPLKKKDKKINHLCEIQMEGNWALFSRENVADGTFAYVLHVLWIKKTSGDGLRVEMLTKGLAE